MFCNKNSQFDARRISKSKNIILAPEEESTRSKRAKRIDEQKAACKKKKAKNSDGCGFTVGGRYILVPFFFLTSGAAWCVPYVARLRVYIYMSSQPASQPATHARQ